MFPWDPVGRVPGGKGKRTRAARELVQATLSCTYMREATHLSTRTTPKHVLRNGERPRPEITSYFDSHNAGPRSQAARGGVADQ